MRIETACLPSSLAASYDGAFTNRCLRCNPFIGEKCRSDALIGIVKKNGLMDYEIESQQTGEHSWPRII